MYTLPEEASTQFLAFLADWFLGRFLKNKNKFSLILNYSTLNKGVAVHLTDLNRLIQIMPGGSAEEVENVRSLNTNRRTDGLMGGRANI